jgi:hypothetical protein
MKYLWWFYKTLLRKRFDGYESTDTSASYCSGDNDSV